LSNGNLLYISPIMPSPGGNGLAMRAYTVMSALSKAYRVHLLVVPVAGTLRTGIPRGVADICKRTMLYSLEQREDPAFTRILSIADPMKRVAAYALYPRPALCRFATEPAIAEIADIYHSVAFEVVHVFRLYMAPFAEPYLKLKPPGGCRLDMDDYESETHRRLAAMYAAAGDGTAAAMEQAEAQKYLHLERGYIGRFERMFVASEIDRRKFAETHAGANIRVIPNGVTIPDDPGEKDPSAPFTFLFVGTMGYYPNEDAVLYFSSDILPLLRQKAGMKFRVVIAGSSPSQRVKELARFPEIQVTGAVSDLRPYYRDADCVIVPVRVGGGTRIKVLEAFSFRRPVVSTDPGVEGIEVRDGEQLFIAHDTQTFADRCLEIMNNAGLGKAIGQRGFDFVSSSHHGEDGIRRTVMQEYPLPPAGDE
jgi:polysaccharide biosynthesis protein PslH